MLVACQQRWRNLKDIVGLSNSMAMIPKRFSQQVLHYGFQEEQQLHWAFPNVWDKVVQFMRYEERVECEIGNRKSDSLFQLLPLGTRAARC